MKQFNFNIDDVNMEVAKRAFYNTSFDPERRGEEIRKNYVEHMQATFEKLQAIAETDEQKNIMFEELERYKIGYIKKLTDWLRSEANCASSMITGPAKFPVEKTENACRRHKINIPTYANIQKNLYQVLLKKLTMPEMASKLQMTNLKD